MASLGYNGTICMRVDHDKYSWLVQSSNQYNLHTTDEMYEGLPELLAIAEDEHKFVLWFDNDFI